MGARIKLLDRDTFGKRIDDHILGQMGFSLID
jgi:hypothetical protein